MPDAAQGEDSFTLAEEMLVEGFEDDEIDDQAAVIPRRIAASR
jgi:hypothetical protein